MRGTAVIVTALAALVAALAPSAPSRAEPVFPSRVVKMIVPYPPGGGTDLLARVLADALGRKWGQSVIVENIGGAGGNVGAAQVARADPDGYTLLLASPGPIATNSYMYKDMPYDPAQWVPIAVLATSPYVLVASPHFDASNLAQVIAQAKAKPGTVSSATRRAPSRQAVGRRPATTAAAANARDSEHTARASPAASRQAISKTLLVSGLGLVIVAAALAAYLSMSPNVPDAPTKANAPTAMTPMAAPTAMAPTAVPPKAAAPVAAPPAAPAPIASSPPSTSPPPPTPPPAAGSSAAASVMPSLPAQVLADDRVRFASFDQARADAIAQATKEAGSKAELDDLTSVLAGSAIPINAKALIGDWRCRTLKLGGGLSGLVIYGFFKCNISAQGDALIF